MQKVVHVSADVGRPAANGRIDGKVAEKVAGRMAGRMAGGSWFLRVDRWGAQSASGGG